MAEKGPSEPEKKRLDQMSVIADKIREDHTELAAYFEQAVPLKADEQCLELGLEKGHLFESQLTSAESISIFEKATIAVCGENATFKLAINCAEASPPRTLSAQRARNRRARHLAAIEEVKRHPRVAEAIEIFAAQVKNVTLPDSAR